MMTGVISVLGKELSKEQQKKFADLYNTVEMQREADYDHAQLSRRNNEEPLPAMNFYEKNHFNLEEEEFKMFKVYLKYKDEAGKAEFNNFLKSIGVNN